VIEFGPEICGDLEQALGKEWLETNGAGGFASSTITGLNSRRYHGLLVAALRPPVERFVLLSKLEETLILGGRRYELSCNEYPGVVHPRGYEHLVRFRLDPFPVFTYRVEDVELEKSLFLVNGENTAVVLYEVTGSGSHDARLEVRPLIAFRDYHALTHENGAIDPAIETHPRRLSIAPYPGLPRLHFAYGEADLDPQGFWFRSLQYAAERERGQECGEDLYSPFALTFDLRPTGRATLIGSLDPRRAEDAQPLRESELARRRPIAAAPNANTPILPPKPLRSPEQAHPHTPIRGRALASPLSPLAYLVRSLTAAADQFIVRRGEGHTILAGYHWFTDWGRDTMIALPGLTLVTGRFDAARGILREFARHADRGMIPNRFPDAGEAAEYNTVDASLWFFEAVRAFGAYTGDYGLIREHLYGPLREIVEWHLRGTRHSIYADVDGLLHAGEPGVQLTWMDAKIGDWVVTPRHGKPVEIQALWYNALRAMEDLARRFGDEPTAKTCADHASRAAASFNRQFWIRDGGYLYDAVDGGRGDPSVRPNQVLAVSLPHTMLSREKARSVVETVRRELLTPYGLRTLSPRDERYRGVYEGDPAVRDARYHQGTVWPWLMGPFVTAYVRVNGRTARSRRQAAEWLAPFREHLRDAGLGSVSEILDGDPPHRPRGCIAQAWSVGEVLRTLVEDVLDHRPTT
jgi:glycogen debranching enzyme